MAPGEPVLSEIELLALSNLKILPFSITSKLPCASKLMAPFVLSRTVEIFPALGPLERSTLLIAFPPPKKPSLQYRFPSGPRTIFPSYEGLFTTAAVANPVNASPELDPFPATSAIVGVEALRLILRITLPSDSAKYKLS